MFFSNLYIVNRYIPSILEVGFTTKKGNSNLLCCRSTIRYKILINSIFETILESSLLLIYFLYMSTYTCIFDMVSYSIFRWLTSSKRYDSRRYSSGLFNFDNLVISIKRIVDLIVQYILQPFYLSSGNALNITLQVIYKYQLITYVTFLGSSR